MIKIFRRIRQKLIRERNLNGYLSYAFGEIVLVVIGILIALQINNLNQQRVQQNELREYLEKIAANMKEDMILAEEHKIRRDTLYERCKNAAMSMFSDEYPFDLMGRANTFIYEFYFNSNRSGYEALKNSAYLGKLKNHKIDSLLHRYYFLVDRIRDMEESYNIFVEQMEVELNTMFPAARITALRNRNRFSKFSDKQREELEANKDELLPYYQSYPFQAGVIRSASEGTSRYQLLIDTGNAFIEELEKCSKENLMNSN